MTNFSFTRWRKLPATGSHRQSGAKFHMRISRRWSVRFWRWRSSGHRRRWWASPEVFPEFGDLVVLPFQELQGILHLGLPGLYPDGTNWVEDFIRTHGPDIKDKQRHYVPDENVYGEVYTMVRLFMLHLHIFTMTSLFVCCKMIGEWGTKTSSSCCSLKTAYGRETWRYFIYDSRARCFSTAPWEIDDDTFLKRDIIYAEFGFLQVTFDACGQYAQDQIGSWA